MNPRLIIVKDVDGGYTLAKYETTVEIIEEENIPVYISKEHYHSLEELLKDNWGE
jgi:hypothetical protein